MAEYIAPIKRLIEEYRRLPGVGAKTAVRYAFATLKLSDEDASRFADAIIGAKRDVHTCTTCCGLTANIGECEICSDDMRDSSVICVVESAKDVMVMERVRGYRGKYHVLGGVLSPIDNVTAEDLNIKELVARVSKGDVSEVIVATNPTPSGDTTAAYIAKILEPYGTEVSRLAYGIPVGGDIEYADEITLLRAMEGRKYFS
ncbi:MAG: recombination protein RecR [Clostridia bacterium]|nr:recombination protein RecR [Clostridia bacterium]